MNVTRTLAAALSLLLLTTLTIPTLVPAAPSAESVAEGSLLVVDAGADLYFPDGFLLAGVMLVRDSSEPAGALRVRSDGPIDVTGTLLGGLQASAVSGQARSGVDLILESSERITVTGRVLAMSGEAGQSVTETDATQDATAGHGGAGGNVYLVAPEVELLGVVLAGNGGPGGNAVGYGVSALGGKGGDGGFVLVSTNAGVTFPSWGEAGNGGSAASTGSSPMRPADYRLPPIVDDGGTLDPDSVAVLPTVFMSCAETEATGGEGGASLGRGGRGGDAILDNSRCIAEAGDDGNKGTETRCHGTDATDGAEGISATATGGNGGPGGITGGDGGNADAKGGAGGEGGKGGDAFSLLSLICTGGKGGDGGRGGWALATGGNGGKGNCSGGPGGQANALGGRGGKGGAGGYPRGEEGTDGEWGAYQSAPGQPGAGSFNC